MRAAASKPILICYDRSAGARHAIETAGSLFPVSKAIVLHVWSPIAIIAAAYGGMVAHPAEALCDVSPDVSRRGWGHHREDDARHQQGTDRDQHCLPDKRPGATQGTTSGPAGRPAPPGPSPTSALHPGITDGRDDRGTLRIGLGSPAELAEAPTGRADHHDNDHAKTKRN